MWANTYLANILIDIPWMSRSWNITSHLNNYCEVAVNVKKRNRAQSEHFHTSAHWIIFVFYFHCVSSSKKQFLIHFCIVLVHLVLFISLVDICYVLILLHLHLLWPFCMKCPSGLWRFFLVCVFFTHKHARSMSGLFSFSCVCLLF